MFPFSRAGHRQPESSSADISSFSFAEYGGAYRKELPNEVLPMFDVYVKEVLEICKAHGVNHPKELVAVTHPRPSFETLERMQFLVDRILYIVENKALPPKEREKEIFDEEDYVLPLPDKIGSLEVTDLHGKLAVFYVKNPVFGVAGASPVKNRHDLFNEEGEEIGDPKGYAQPSDVLDINGIPGFADYQSGKYTFHCGKKTLGNPDGYEHGTLCAIGGKPVVIVAKGHLSPFQIITEKQTLEGMSTYTHVEADHMSDVEGRLFFFTKNESGKTVLVLNGKIVGDPEGYGLIEFEKFHSDPRRSACVTRVRKVKASDAACVALKTDGRWYVLNFKGETIGDPAGYTACWRHRSDSPYSYIVQDHARQEWFIKKDGTLLDRQPDPKDIEEPFSVKKILHPDAGEEYRITYNATGEISVSSCHTIMGPPKYPDLSVLSLHETPVFAVKVPDSFAYIIAGGEKPTDPFVKIVGRFEMIYALRKLDENRFYIVALQKNDEGKNEVIKKVVDLRTVEPLP